MYLTKKILLIVALLALPFTGSSASTAASVLKSAADKITSSKTLTADFTVSSANNPAIKGSLSIDRKKFVYKTPERTIIYNGTTQWTVDPDVKEISIYNPEPGEIDPINPFAMISNYKSLYNARLLNATSASTYRVELTPKSSGESMKKVVITFNSSTYLPSVIEMTLSDGSSARVSVSNIKTSANIPASRFVLDKGAYPGYEIIDLR